MAITLGNRIQNGTVVGAFVYESYTPAKCGVVIADLGPMNGGYFHLLRVKTIKGEIQDINSGRLNDYDALIADHEKKLAGHLDRINKLKKIKQDSA